MSQVIHVRASPGAVGWVPRPRRPLLADFPSGEVVVSLPPWPSATASEGLALQRADAAFAAISVTALLWAYRRAGHSCRVIIHANADLALSHDGPLRLCRCHLAQSDIDEVLRVLAACSGAGEDTVSVEDSDLPAGSDPSEADMLDLRRVRAACRASAWMGSSFGLAVALLAGVPEVTLLAAEPYLLRGGAAARWGPGLLRDATSEVLVGAMVRVYVCFLSRDRGLRQNVSGAVPNKGGAPKNETRKAELQQPETYVESHCHVQVLCVESHCPPLFVTTYPVFLSPPIPACCFPFVHPIQLSPDHGRRCRCSGGQARGDGRGGGPGRRQHRHHRPDQRAGGGVTSAAGRGRCRGRRGARARPGVARGYRGSPWQERRRLRPHLRGAAGTPGT